MKSVFFSLLHIVLVYVLQSCGIINHNEYNLERAIASIENDKCKTTNTPDNISSNMMAICNIAFTYIEELIGKDFSIQVTNRLHTEAKRHVLDMSIVTTRKNLDQIIGRGGLRIKYLRFLLNELSFEQVRKEYKTQNKEKEAIYNFPLVDLTLAPVSD